MKKILLLVIPFFLAACSGSFIKVDVKSDADGMFMYGYTAERNFFLDKVVGDSIIFKWENALYGSFAFNSAICYDSLLFVNDLSGKIFCFNYYTGKKKGQLKYRGSILTAPVFYKYNLIFPVSEYNDMNSYIISYDVTRGYENFKIPVSGKILSQPLLVKDKIFMLTESGLALLLNTRGDIEMQVETGVFSHSNPVSDGENIYWGTDDGRIISMKIGDTEIKKSSRISNFPLNSPVLHSDNLYITDENGGAFSISKKSFDIKWALKTMHKYRAAPVLDGKYMYMFSLDGFIISVSPDSGEIVNSANLNSFFNVVPLVTANYIIAPDFWGSLKFYDKETLEVKISRKFESRMKLTPILFRNHLLIGMDSGILQAYEIK